MVILRQLESLYETVEGIGAMIAAADVVVLTTGHNFVRLLLRLKSGPDSSSCSKNLLCTTGLEDTGEFDSALVEFPTSCTTTFLEELVKFGGLGPMWCRLYTWASSNRRRILTLAEKGGARGLVVIVVT